MYRFTDFDVSTPRIRLSGAGAKWSSGEIIALYGNSGSGADLFCLLLAGLIDKIGVTLPAGKGRLLRQEVTWDKQALSVFKVDGQELYRLEPSERAKRVAVIFSNPELYIIGNTVLEEFQYTFAAINRPNPPLQALRRYGLYGKATYRTETLSGGEQHRLNWACALESDPNVLIADLSRSNLDNDFTQHLIAWLSEERSNKVTVVYGLRPGQLEGVDHTPYTIENGHVREGMPDASDFPTIAKARESVRQKYSPRTLGTVLLQVRMLGHAELLDRVKAVSFDLHRNEVLQVRGPNGSGKTTLGRILSGRIPRDLVVGTPTPELSSFKPVMCLQHPERFFLRGSVDDELHDVDMRKMCGLTAEQGRLSPLDLAPSKRKLLAAAVTLQISDGFAILDEPTAGMDHSDKIRFIELLNSKANLPVVITSHDDALLDVGTVREWGEMAP